MNKLRKLFRYASFAPRGGCTMLFDIDPAPAGDDPPALHGATAPEKAPETHTVKVNGQEVSFTLEELKAKAAESVGAQAKFDEAARLRKAYSGIDPDEARRGQEALRLGAKMNRGETLTAAEETSFFKSLGIDPTLFADPTEASGTPKSAPKPAAAAKVAFEQLDPETQKALTALRSQQMVDTERKINENLQKVLDNDPILSKMIEATPAAAREARKAALSDIAESDIWALIGGGQEVGPELYQHVAQRLRARAKAFGIQTDPANIPLSVAIPGYDVFGPGVSLDEPIKRKKVTDSGYDDNAGARLAQDIARRRRQGPSQ